MSNRKPPERIGKFRILGTLGSGGMGDVYRGIQEPLNRTVAIKVLPEEFARNEEFLQRFVTEAKAISRLEHQNIVGIYDYGTEDGLQYIAMRYIEGQSLSQKLSKEKRLPPETAVEYARQICRALKYAHEKEIIHRDIKPQNILLGPGGRVFVTDFGIAKLYEQNSVTRTGVVVGTPEYMSPEQAEGRELNPQTDLYSLGIVLHEMISGEPPFVGDNPLSIAYKHVNVAPPPLSEKVSGVPKRLEMIVLRALKKDRTVRYQNGDEFLQDLDKVFEECPDPTTRGMARLKPGEPVVAPLPREDENRITDRRDLERRREPRRAARRRFTSLEKELNNKRRRKFLFLLVLLFVLTGVGIFLALHRSPDEGASSSRLPMYARVVGNGGADNALDEDARTSWVGGGHLPSFSFTYWRSQTINRIDLLSGSNLTPQSFAEYSRPKRIRLSFDDKTDFELDLEDTPERQVVRLPIQNDIRKVRVTVLEVFPGTLSSEPALSEVRLWFSPAP